MEHRKVNHPPERKEDAWERLRRFAAIEDDMFKTNNFKSAKSPSTDAADEIERLRACVRSLKNGMNQMSDRMVKQKAGGGKPNE